MTPLGVGADALTDRWIDGISGIEGGEAPCSEFEPTEFLSRKEARRSDRFTQLALGAAIEALAAAGWEGDNGGSPVDPDRVGCVIGTGIGGLGSMEHGVGVLREKGEKALSPLSVPLMMGNAASAAISMRFGIHGPSYGVVSACAAGAHAIGTAIGLIRSGQADCVVTGGAEATLVPVARASFATLGATSPTGLSCPFDSRRDGFVMGEGAGVLVLESEESAAERDAPVLGRILGYAATSDAHHLTAPEPDGRDAARAITLALADADRKPEQLAYVNAHGTSTPLNDHSETMALKAALGEPAMDIPTSSLKSAIGHLLGAAGAVEAIATIGALRRGVAPPTLNLEQPDPELDLDYVPLEARPLAGPNGNGNSGNGERLAISNSFGFGGHNAVLCLAAEEAS